MSVPMIRAAREDIIVPFFDVIAFSDALGGWVWGWSLKLSFPVNKQTTTEVPRLSIVKKY